MAESTRRAFLKTAAVTGMLASGVGASSAAARADEGGRLVVPRRRLGKIGAEVSMLGLGLGSAFTSPFERDREAGQALLVKALDHGINYFDTARGYGPSEEMIAPVVRAHRERIYLVSKSGARDYDGFMREFDRSVRNLGVDRIDLFHLHNLKPGQDDLDRMERGCLRAVRQLKEQGVIDAFGVTGHSGAQILTDAVARFDPDAILTIFPVTRPDAGRYESETLKLAREKRMGVIAMKIFRRAREADLKPADMIGYAWSLPGVHCAIIGLDQLVHLEQNAEIAANFEPLDEARRDELHRVASARLGDYPAPYELPGYEDAHRSVTV
ncbi:aldo/keto reductase [Mucisphaera sp.]|uniref:aldo/keto reductase n=1 Tax=Mucisphaera sp. TaxID=2913024 RepID=UPI003D14422C